MTETYTAVYKGEEFEVERYSYAELEELKNRVRTGNERLITAFKQIMAGPPEKREELFDQWHTATRKLSFYCDQLNYLGFDDCLYIQDGVKTRKCLEGMSCIACPSKKKYWEDELMEEAKNDL